MWLQQPFQEKAEFTAHRTCIGGKPVAPHFSEGNPSATHMLYPSLIVMSITLELRTRSHHHYNPFKDELSTCIYRPEQEAAFCSQFHRRYPQPEARWSIPALFLSYTLLHAAWRHRSETPATAATPGCTRGSHRYSRLPNSPGCADSFFCNFPSPAYTSIQLHVTFTASPPTPTVLLLLLNVLCQELLVLKRGP